MLSPEQCRAARGWLGWTQDQLAERARVSLSTVRDFEKGRRTPIANNLEALIRALMDAGIRLRFDGIEPVGIEWKARAPQARAAESEGEGGVDGLGRERQSRSSRPEKRGAKGA